MYYKNKLGTLYTIFKTKFYRLGFIWLLLFSLSIINIGCNKCDEIGAPDEYYIKYEVNSSTIYYGRKLDVTIKTENNVNDTIVVDQRTKWETTIGPVEKGFNSILRVETQGATSYKLELNAAIYVSKNGSPFALKEIDDSDILRKSLQISYIIDY